MPTVGSGKTAKHFDYSPKGIAEAKAYAKKTGQPLKMDASKMKGKAATGKGRMGY